MVLTRKAKQSGNIEDRRGEGGRRDAPGALTRLSKPARAIRRLGSPEDAPMPSRTRATVEREISRINARDTRTAPSAGPFNWPSQIQNPRHPRGKTPRTPGTGR